MMKGQKGITLVALVITIIVMLILVGVSITVAMNGGLFEKATNASNDTRKSQIKEAITLAKAELLADFYSAADQTKPTGAEVAGKINAYLDGIVVTVADPAGSVYTVNPPADITLETGETLTLSLAGITFATTAE